MSLLSNPYIPPAWKEAQDKASVSNTDFPSQSNTETISLFEDFILPSSTKTEEIKQSSLRPLFMGNQNYPLQNRVPSKFKTEFIPLGTEDMVKQIVVMAKIDDAVLNAGRR